MNYKVTSEKSIEQILKSLETVLPQYRFGLQHTHNMQQNLNNKGIEFDTESLILDVCQPQVAAELLNIDLNLSCVMPCKITLNRKDDQTIIALNPLVKMVEMLNPQAINIAKEAETTLQKIVDAIK